MLFSANNNNDGTYFNLNAFAGISYPKENALAASATAEGYNQCLNNYNANSAHNTSTVISNLCPAQEKCNGVVICRVLKLEYLDDEMDLAYLKHIFSKFLADIVDIRIARDCVVCVDIPTRPGSSVVIPKYVKKNSAFIEFLSTNSAVNFMHIFHNKILPYSNPLRYINLSWTPRKLPPTVDIYGTPVDDGSAYEYIPMQETTLFVSKIDKNVTTDQLSAIFHERYCSVSAVKLCHSTSPKGELLPKGTGLVRFLNAEEAVKCLCEMNGEVIGTSPLTLAASKLTYRVVPSVPMTKSAFKFIPSLGKCVYDDPSQYVQIEISDYENNINDSNKGSTHQLTIQNCGPDTNNRSKGATIPMEIAKTGTRWSFNMNSVEQETTAKTENEFDRSGLNLTLQPASEFFVGLSCMSQSPSPTPDVSFDFLNQSSPKIYSQNCSMDIRYSIEYNNMVNVTQNYYTSFGSNTSDDSSFILSFINQ